MFNIDGAFTSALGSIFWNLILPMWYVWLLLIIFAVMPGQLQAYAKKKANEKRFVEGKKWHEDKELIKWLQGIKPSEFEDFIAELYSRLGYKTEKVGRAYDGGVDVIASKDGIINYIQCKKFITSQVGVEQVREFVGVLVGKLANGNGIFITTNIFTTEAKKYAEESMIELIDGYKLTKLIRSVDLKIDSEIEDDENQKCPKCGGDLIRKKRRDDENVVFWGCANYPRCHFTKNIK